MTDWNAASVRTSDEEASLSLFPSVKDALAQSGLELQDLKAIAFCEGPGSMLGIRTAVMGIRTWKSAGLLGDCQILSFSSLEVGRLLIAAQTDEAFTVVTDARRNSWNALDSSDPIGAPARLIANEDLEQLETARFSFHDFPSWTRCAAPIERIDYRPESVFRDSRFGALLRENPNAEIPTARAQEFAKWVPQARTGDRIAQ